MRLLTRPTIAKCIYLILLSLFMNSCQTTQRTFDHEDREWVDKREETSNIDNYIEELDNEMLDNIGDANDKAPTIPIEMNAKVQKWISYFTGRGRGSMQRYIERGGEFRPFILKTLRDHGIPEDLFYLAMIESGFRVTARSHASAVGVWQFIRPTGRRYGLIINHETDERQDPIRATRAAARYLQDLHNVFQSWYLAMAAYNAGEMRIMNSIMKGNTRNFWKLADMGLLPRETMNYVPKFIAARIIGKHPQKFGFVDSAVRPMPELELVAVPSPIRLQDIASAAGVSSYDLSRFNPNLRYKQTPSDRPTYSIWLPSESAKILKGKRQMLAKLRMKQPTRVASTASMRHKVKAGESLYTIARSYGIPIKSLMATNGLKSIHLRVGKQLIIPSATIASTRKYRVRRGDNLRLISRKFGVSVSKLRQLNGIRGSKLLAGQTIRVN